MDFTLRRFTPEFPLMRYAITVVSVLLTLLVRQLLDPLLGDRLPFGFLFIVVMVIAWWFGTKATLLALVLSSLAGIFLFVPPRNSLGFASIPDFLGWVIFVAVGLGSAIISDARYREQQKAQAALQQLGREVQQHRQTLATLKTKETEVTDFIENAASPLHEVDREGTIVWVNQAELDLLGYSQNEYVGHPIAEFHADPAVIADILQRLTQDEILHSYEARLRHKNGSIKHVLISSSVYRKEGEFVHTRCATSDITDRKIAEEIRSRLSAIVEFSDDAIVSKTLEGIVVSWNRGATKVFGYSSEEMVGKSIRILFPPDRLYEEDDFLRRIANGEHIDHYETVRVRKDGQQITISVTLSPIYDAGGKVIGVSKIARDITDRERHEQRTALLLELSKAFSEALTSSQIAAVVVEQALKALGARVGGVSLLVEGGTTLEILSLQGAAPEVMERYHLTAWDAPLPVNDAIRTDTLLWIETQQEYIARYPHLQAMIEHDGTRSIICVPLQMDEKMLGGISLSFPVEKRCAPDEEAFFTTLGLMCAQSLERARLYEAEQKERALAEALRDTVISLSSTWELSEVFDEILENISRVVKHDMADIMLLENGVARVVRSHRYAEHGLVASEPDMEHFSLKVADIGHLQWVVEHKQPWLIEDTQTHPTWAKMHEPDIIRSTLIVPILVAGEITGFLNVDSLTPHFYTLEDAEHLQVFANHAAVAIRNAQLHQQALQLAAQDERQRIARDLHDSVNQTLFAANVIAEALPRLWELKPERARVQTENLYELIRGASAEMRVLLVELRPESLIKTDLGDLLTHLTYALPGRSDLDLSVVLKGESGLLPPEVQIAFYRIVQESLNNVIKHGQAVHGRIRLSRTGRQVILMITDDGCGFDTQQTSGGIGLKSMQERATSIQASFSVKSRSGRGTQIKLVWTRQDDRPENRKLEGIK